MQTEVIKRIVYLGKKPSFDVELFKAEHLIHPSGLLVHNLGTKVEKTLLENIEMVTRQHKLSFFFLSPKHIRHNYHYFMETWQAGGIAPYDETKNLEEQWKYTRSVIFDHRQYALGFVITTLPSNREFLDEYEKKKNRFIERVRSRRGSRRGEFLRNEGLELLKNPNFFREFCVAKNKDMKATLIDMYLSGQMMATTEQRRLVSYIEYIINSDENLAKEAENLKPKKESRKKQSTEEGIEEAGE